ncbi:lysis protein [Dryocola sp. LX212]
MTFFNWKTFAVGMLIVMMVVTAKIAAHEKRRAESAEINLAQATSTIENLKTRQRDVAALDAKYTGELESAKANIEQLQRDVAAGAKRLRVSATCKPVSKSTSATSMDDATGPRLTDAAERDYFTLRQRIEKAGKQIAGLQEYIRQQCLSQPTGKSNE